MRRSAVVVAAFTAALTACSGGDEPIAADDAAASTVASSTTVAEPVRDAGAAVVSTTAPAAESEVTSWTVAFDVSVTGFEAPDIAASTALEFDPADPGDPFDVSASCSGLRNEVAAYSAFVSGGADVSYVGLWTSDPLGAPGIYDVQIRVEHDGSMYDAFGTMTLADDLRSAEFVGFGPSGGEIAGRFRCEGGPGPVPLVLGAADGDFDSVEVFALLRRDAAIRVVGLATTELVLADCPAVGSGDEEGVAAVAVRGGPDIGSITAFEATADRVAMRAGSTDFAFDVVDLTPAGGAGTISAAAADGTVLDAAYRCT